MGDLPLPRSERIARRLQAHVVAGRNGRPSARERLEAELGPELTRRLLAWLTQPHSASPESDAVWPSIGTNSQL